MADTLMPGLRISCDGLCRRLWYRSGVALSKKLRELDASELASAQLAGGQPLHVFRGVPFKAESNVDPPKQASAAFPEYRTADTHAGRAFFDGHFEIVRHPHGEHFHFNARKPPRSDQVL